MSTAFYLVCLLPICGETEVDFTPRTDMEETVMSTASGPGM